jgi:hypothetical protein
MRCVLVTLIALGFVAALAGAASASITVNDDAYISLWANRPSSQSEGPFVATVYHDPDGAGVHNANHTAPNLIMNALVFCVETRRYFSAGGSWFDVNGTSNQTIDTNLYLSGYSAWVYTKFRDTYKGSDGLPLDPEDGPGSLTGAIANLYQYAIWAGVVGKNPDGSFKQIGGTSSEYHDWFDKSLLDWTPYNQIGIGWNDFLSSGWPGSGGTDAQAMLRNLGNATVLNIDNGTSYWGQDQIIMIPGGNDVTVVPEPTSVLIWSAIGVLVVIGGLTGKRLRR